MALAGRSTIEMDKYHTKQFTLILLKIYMPGIKLESQMNIVFVCSCFPFRYESNSGGEREIQRTMLELLNQLDGFDSKGDVKVRQINW